MSAQDERRAVFDPAAFERQTGGDAALRAEIIQMFLEDCPGRVEQIRAAVDGNDAAGLVSAAHALKGSAGYLCASILRTCAADLERAGRDRNLDAARPLVADLDAAVAQLIPELTNAHGK